ncbi:MULTISPECIES: DUF1367 family protein [Serratia]|uniref:DUF1367 family protein n=1 Tax=Serratia TaxID=613 RepID=UPI0007453D6C|nr:DUF1367 family protein [Serratia marcescens]CUY33110.1 Protein of uncharacterised function (DUF1367) [Serratia marcescens]
MAQYSFVKSAGNLLVPATPDAIEFLKTKVKIGAVLYADFSQARNPAFHRKYFSLLNLGFQYWEPTGGAISPTDKELITGYVKFLAYYAGNESTLQAAADEYLQDVAEKRAGNISSAKSFEAFRAWVTIQSGHYTAYQMPDGSERKEPRSVSFAKMDDIEFSEFYKAVLDVLWNYILFRTFPDQQSAENAAAQLMGYTS